MTAAIAIAGIAVFTATIIGFVVGYTHANKPVGVFTMIGSIMASIVATIVFINYEPAVSSDSTISHADVSVLDSIGATFAEGFAELTDAFAAIIPLLLFELFGLILSLLIPFNTNSGKQ